MFATKISLSRDYLLDLPSDVDYTGTGGLWDMADDLIRLINRNSDHDELQQNVYDILTEFRKNSMALGMHELGEVTPNKAVAWINLYESIRDNFQNYNMPEGTSVEQKSILIKDLLKNMGFNVSSDYSSTHPYLDFDVNYADGSYGVRIFFSYNPADESVTLQKDFYGYMYGDDTIYEDMNLDLLKEKLD